MAKTQFLSLMGNNSTELIQILALTINEIMRILIKIGPGFFQILLLKLKTVVTEGCSFKDLYIQGFKKFNGEEDVDH